MTEGRKYWLGCLPAIWQRRKENPPQSPQPDPLLELYLISTLTSAYIHQFTSQPLAREERELLTALEASDNCLPTELHALKTELDEIHSDHQAAFLPKQYDMFKGKLVDNRTRKQKKNDREKAFTQSIMFCQRDIAHFGVDDNPLLPLSPNVKLMLISEDPRTEEEIERDRQREAERLTVPMFKREITNSTEQVQETTIPPAIPIFVHHAEQPSHTHPVPPGLFAAFYHFALYSD